MPRRRPFRTRTMVAVGIGGVLAGLAMAAAVLLAAGGGEVEVRLGDDEFRAGRVDSLLAAIERGGPIAFGDLVGGDRPLYVLHRGPDDDEGWEAVGAVAPGQDSDCVLTWDPDEGRFADPCSEESYEPDDARLRRYRTEVRDDFVYVDLRAAG